MTTRLSDNETRWRDGRLVGDVAHFADGIRALTNVIL